MIDIVIEEFQRLTTLAHLNRQNLALFLLFTALVLFLASGLNKDPHELGYYDQREYKQWQGWSRWVFRGLYTFGNVVLLLVLYTGSGDLAVYALVLVSGLLIIGAIGGLMATWWFETRIQNLLWASSLVGTLGMFFFSISLVTGKQSGMTPWLRNLESDFVAIYVAGILLTFIGAILYLLDMLFRKAGKGIIKALEPKPRTTDDRVTSTLPQVREGDLPWQEERTGTGDGLDDELSAEPRYVAPSALRVPAVDDKSRRRFVDDEPPAGD